MDCVWCFVQASRDKMTFVIIRPGGLKSEPATGNAVLTESTKVCGAVTRTDVAHLAVKALFSDNANNKVLMMTCHAWLICILSA